MDTSYLLKFVISTLTLMVTSLVFIVLVITDVLPNNASVIIIVLFILLQGVLNQFFLYKL